ncbi:AAA family ATPase [Streptomyces sp. NPDC058441]|uniref:AAA family ATPase n=1 Tax=Streptomyces sp. NPDC058441 TaxID=3346502 RepID=UPI00365CB9C9
MNEGVGNGDLARAALTVGLSVASRYEDGLLVLGELDTLDEAPAHAASVSGVLREFGYTETWHPDEAADPGEGIRKAVTCGDTGVLVVHVVAHGRLAETGERELHVVGGDGQNLDDPVSSWIGLIESHPKKSRPLTLFILDLCHSGAAATLPWHQQMQVGDRRAWVIAASGREHKAFGYRLSRATTAVLRQYLDGTLRVDPSYRHIPLPTIAHEIDRAVAELNAAEGYPQQIEVSRVPFTARLDDLPFFPNPGHQDRGSALSVVDAGIASMLDEAFDPRHFMLRGASAEPLERGLGQGYFRGRDPEVRTLTAWLNGHGPGFRIVTGKPGVGKSALLGVLVCAAHPRLRDVTRNLWSSLPVKPGRNERLAVVHARRRDLEQITDSLARQMGATETDRPADGWATQSLVKLAQATPDIPFTLVIDALDEAERPDDVTQALLLPLARAALGKSPSLRLLVGSRSAPRFDALSELAANVDGLLNLDDVSPHDVYDALQLYVRDLLAIDSPYDAQAATDAATALAEGIATRLTGIDDPTWLEDRTRLPGWGEFLVAGLYLRHVLTLPTEHDPELARALGLAVPVELPELLELDLARRADQPYLRPVLSALAHAEGRGMPERALAHIAPAFTLPAPSDGPMTTDHVQEALAQARFYLRRDIDTDGTTLYRLFHEGLAERLRAYPYGPQGQEQN